MQRRSHTHANLERKAVAAFIPCMDAGVYDSRMKFDYSFVTPGILPEERQTEKRPHFAQPTPAFLRANSGGNTPQSLPFGQMPKPPDALLIANARRHVFCPSRAPFPPHHRGEANFSRSRFAREAAKTRRKPVELQVEIRCRPRGICPFSRLRVSRNRELLNFCRA